MKELNAQFLALVVGGVYDVVDGATDTDTSNGEGQPSDNNGENSGARRQF